MPIRDLSNDRTLPHTLFSSDLENNQNRYIIKITEGIELVRPVPSLATPLNCSNLNSACLKFSVPIKIFQIQDILNETERYLDTTDVLDVWPRPKEQYIMLPVWRSKTVTLLLYDHNSYGLVRTTLKKVNNISNKLFQTKWLKALLYYYSNTLCVGVG